MRRRRSANDKAIAATMPRRFRAEGQLRRGTHQRVHDKWQKAPPESGDWWKSREGGVTHDLRQHVCRHGHSSEQISP